MLYLDTAVLVTLFVDEDTSAAVQSWLSRRKQEFACSDWSLTEATSALGIKVRRGDLDSEAALRIQERIVQFVSQQCTCLPCLRPHHQQASAWLTRFELGLRAGDALHLAVAAANGATIASYDKTMLIGAKALGLKAANPLA